MIKDLVCFESFKENIFIIKKSSQNLSLVLELLYIHSLFLAGKIWILPPNQKYKQTADQNRNGGKFWIWCRIVNKIIQFSFSPPWQCCSFGSGFDRCTCPDPWVGITFRDLSQSHAIFERFLATFTIVSGFFKENIAFLGDEAHKTLIAYEISALSIGVDQVVLFPLAQASVFAFCKENRLLEIVQKSQKNEKGEKIGKIGKNVKI